MKIRILLLTLLALAVAAPMYAQERERKRDVKEAIQRLEAAQKALEETLARLRESQDDVARMRLEETMRELRRVQSELWSSRFLDRVMELRDRVGSVEIIKSPGEGRTVVFTVNRPRMGVIVATDSRPATDSIGAVLTNVTPGSPAAEAGLENQDIIVSVNGEQLARTARRDVKPGEKLIRIVREHNEGDTLRVTYRRDGETRNTDVVLRELDSGAFAYGFATDSSGVNWFEVPRVEVEVPRIDIDPEFRAKVAPRVEVRGMPFGWLDIELVSLNEELGEYFGATEGVLVIEAPEDESLRLRSGDVILAIDGRKPRSPSHALRIFRSYSAGETMEIEVMREKRRVTLSVTVPERGGNHFRRRQEYW
jgi:predicted metalloprotease with PDZ domain